MEEELDEYMTPEEEYREGLINALENLKKVNDSIVDTLVPILVNGELNEWNQEVPVGEVHKLDFEIFRNSDDVNIQLLVGLMDAVTETFRSINNINALDVDEG